MDGASLCFLISFVCAFCTTPLPCTPRASLHLSHILAHPHRQPNHSQLYLTPALPSILLFFTTHHTHRPHPQNFMSDSEFCFRACNPASKNAPTFCQHVYDEMGCQWNMPSAGYKQGVFERCSGAAGEVRSLIPLSFFVVCGLRVPYFRAG